MYGTKDRIEIEILFEPLTIDLQGEEIQYVRDLVRLNLHNFVSNVDFEKCKEL